MKTRSAVFNSLESPISAGGGSLSAGQKQLVALARAMMRRAKVVLTDEATSAIDLELDDRVSDSSGISKMNKSLTIYSDPADDTRRARRCHRDHYCASTAYRH